MTDDAEDMGLTTLVVDRVAHGLAVDSQALVGRRILRVPGVQCPVEQRWVNAGEHIADEGAAGDLIAAIAIAATKAGAGLLAQVLGPFADRLVAARAAQDRGGGDGQHAGQGVAPSLRAARVGDVGEKRREGTHVLGTQHEFWGSMVVSGIEHGPGQVSLGLADQRADENPLGRLRPGAVALTGTAKATAIAHILPIGGTVDRAVEMAWVDEGLQQPQWVAEPLTPVLRQAALAQRQDA